MKDNNIVLSLNDYTIYDNVYYYLCVPKTVSNFYHVFIGFSEKDLVKLTTDDLILEIRKIADSINAAYKNGIYVLPVIPNKLLIDATCENDDRLYNKILNNIIQPITFEIYKLFTTNNMRVSQIIKLIKQNDIDTKLVGWLSIKLGNYFIKEITFEQKNDNTQDDVIEIETVTHDNGSIFVADTSDDKSFVDNEIYISDSLKPAVSPGFSSWGLIIMVLFIAIVFGGIITYMIIK